MEYKLKVYSIWDCGKRVDANGEPHQEDSMFPLHGEATDSDRLFILCDGMGGHEAGEVASATVCEAMGKSILSATPNPEGHFSEHILERAIMDAYNALDEKDNSASDRKMGTTMTLLKLYDGGCFIAHIGDSRVYHIRPGRIAGETRIVFRTEDHSLVNQLVKFGELTPEQAKLSRKKNIITRAMQPHTESRSKADIHHIMDIRPGDYFYLCSDGMLENMEDEQLCYFFSDEAGNDENKVTSLLKATQENRDNHSAIIVHITDVKNPIGIEDNDIPLCENRKNAKMLLLKDCDDFSGNVNRRKKFDKSKWLIFLLLAIIIVLVIVVFFPLKSQKEQKDKAIENPINTHRPISKPDVNKLNAAKNTNKVTTAVRELPKTNEKTDANRDSSQQKKAGVESSENKETSIPETTDNHSTNITESSSTSKTENSTEKQIIQEGIQKATEINKETEDKEE